MRTGDNLYVVLDVNEAYVSAYVHQGFGSGRGRRRRLVDVVRIPRTGPDEALIAVLRDVAHQLETRPSERYQPRP